MPRIPIPEYQQRISVPLDVGPSPRMQPVAVSDSVGRALESLGASVQDYALKFQQEQNRAAVDDAYANTFGPKFRELYQGYYSLQGKDALDQRGDYEKRIKQVQSETRQSLDNDAQRRVFDDMTARRVEEEFNSMARHAAQQRRVWLGATHEAAKSNILAQVADKWNDDTLFQRGIQSGLAEIDQYGSSIGASSEVMRAEATGFTSAAWTSRIERAVLDDPLAAQSLYQAHSSDILPEVRPVLERKLQSAVLPVQAKSIAQDLLGSVGDGASTDIRGNMDDLLKAGADKAEEAHPGNLVFADLVQQQIKGHLATIAQAQEANERQALSVTLRAAYGAPDATGRLTRAKPLTLESLLTDKNVSAAWQTMTPQAQLGVLGVLRQNAHEAENGGAAMRTDPRVFQQLWDRVSLPDSDPNKIRSWTEVAPYLSRGISTGSFDFLVKRIEQNKTEDGQRIDTTRNSFLSAVKPQFDKSTMIQLDEKGGEDFYRFKTYVLQREAEYHKAGKSVYDLYNPNSPDYLGKAIPTFQRSIEEQLRGMADSQRRAGGATALPPSQQRRAGESIEQYRKRVGLQ